MHDIHSTRMNYAVNLFQPKTAGVISLERRRHAEWGYPSACPFTRMIVKNNVSSFLVQRRPAAYAVRDARRRGSLMLEAWTSPLGEPRTSTCTEVLRTYTSSMLSWSPSKSNL